MAASRWWRAVRADRVEGRKRVNAALECLVAEATKRGIPDKPDVKFMLDVQRQNTLIQALLRDEMEKKPITDADIKAAYEQQKAKVGAKAMEGVLEDAVTSGRFTEAQIFDLHASALAWLEDYTAIPYAFGKFDFVLIPSFQFGGMEHAGKILYNASGLMLDESATQRLPLPSTAKPEGL